MFSLFRHLDFKLKRKPRFCAGKIAAGFTLIEMMVTVAMAAIIMAVVLFENTKFNNSIILTNAAYEVALTVRQAQVFGLSSRAVSTGSTQRPYGVYVSIVNDGERKYAHLFADTDTPLGSNNVVFQLSEEITGGVALGRGLVIKDICFKEGVDLNCGSIIPGDMYKSVTIFFRRPNPEAVIRRSDGTINTASFVEIVLGPFDNDTDRRCVKIYNSGQVSVKC